MKYIKWHRKMKEEENHQANRPTNLKITSLEQVYFICMLILSFILNKMANKDERRRKSLNKYSTKSDIIAAGMFYLYVYI